MHLAVHPMPKITRRRRGDSAYLLDDGLRSAMFKGSRAVARDVLAQRRWKLRAVFARFDDEILLWEGANGSVTCDDASTSG
jgi:hypothetical protein